MASWLGIDVGTYNQLSDSMHLYINDLKEFGYNETESNNTNTDKLNLSYEESQIYFKALFDKMKIIVKNELSESDFYKLFDENLKVEALDNMFMIIGADAARRKKYNEITLELVNRCTNPIYKELWENWSDRQKTRIPLPSFI
jgi:thymidylate synthase